MNPKTVALVFAAGVLAGCMTAGPPAPAQVSVPAASSNPRMGVPLVLDRGDFRLGATIQFARIPSANELYELHNTTGLAHVVLSLSSWPASYAELQPLEQKPEEADLIILLPGYPPTREAAEAWNLVRVPTRLILVVPSTPPATGVINDLNAMRSLERVIVDTDSPTRFGFERLQRPISFRVIRD